MTNTMPIEFIQNLPKDSKVCLITTKGGGGHLQAANALEKELYSTGIACLKVDLLEDHFAPSCIGRFLTGMWDKAKKEGNGKKLEQFANGTFCKIPCRRAADALFYLPVFLGLSTRLFLYPEMNTVIDTQPLCTSAVAAAIGFIRFITRRKVCLYKVLTDFPTPQCVHFAEGVKRTALSMRKTITLVSAPPLLGAYPSDEEFWKNVFGVEKSQVLYDSFPIRENFRKKTFSPSLQLSTSSEEEMQLLKELLTGYQENSHFILTDLPASTWGVISLGSIAEQKATLKYINSFLQKTETPLTLFIACGNKENGLYNQVAAVAQKEKNGLNRIIPLSFQSDLELAPLFHFANFGVYATGGSTLQEAYTVATGKIFMHSQEKSSIVWEEGNLLWMKHFRQAARVTPATVCLL